jgi:hypothetical protein
VEIDERHHELMNMLEDFEVRVVLMDQIYS